ncbi:hypothetical protein [Mycobacterium szulgai]|uniref:hypothetical protein n=1 Tax=Mycobacterium szulgai TaxID=1787 RepID=UPI0021F36993|nr:hypothetical protein [Mycobacterium szulgai]
MASKAWVQQSGAVTLLADAYRRARGGYVAFLDESFELGANRRTFYLMSAVVAHRDQLEPSTATASSTSWVTGSGTRRTVFSPRTGAGRQ